MGQRLARHEQGYERLQRENQQLHLQLTEVSTYRDNQIQARQAVKAELEKIHGRVETMWPTLQAADPGIAEFTPSCKQVSILCSSWTRLRDRNIALQEQLEQAESQEDKAVQKLMRQIPLEEGQAGHYKLKRAVRESITIYSTVQDWMGDCCSAEKSQSKNYAIALSSLMRKKTPPLIPWRKSQN
jgi:DNA repair exonuclease SbcCD ATPase subunit